MTVENAPPVLALNGPHGILYDFNDGCRVYVPECDDVWRVQLSDIDAACRLFDQTLKTGTVQSSKRYYVRFRLRVWRGEVLVFEHDHALEDQEVLIRMHLGGIGDHLAWMGHVAAFQENHKARVTCLVRPDVKPLLQPVYPEMRFVAPEEALPQHFYATYSVMIFFNDTARNHLPVDYRQVGLVTMAAYILGLTPQERRPRVAISEGGRPFPEKYVCIATQGSTFTKFWHNPRGWLSLIQYLKEAGYRVLCIDRERRVSRGPVWRGIPYGAEDFTGDLPLAERALLIKNAEFFIGLSSGLSWLAWAVGVPVVLISGFTDVFNEFTTQYRVINRHTCHGCGNDSAIELERTAYFWCPRHQDTQREFECSRLISFEQVRNVMAQLPALKGRIDHE